LIFSKKNGLIGCQKFYWLSIKRGLKMNSKEAFLGAVALVIAATPALASTGSTTDSKGSPAVSSTPSVQGNGSAETPIVLADDSSSKKADW
jgi:hypothetical protein